VVGGSKIFSMNTYIFPEYSCKVSVEINIYFELQKKTKLWLRIDSDFCQKFVFFV
jgi:hypothetical protein